MDVLQRLLTPVVSAPGAAKGVPHVSSGTWKGHGVQPVPLSRELKLDNDDAVADTDTITRAIGQRYGAYVQGRMEMRLQGEGALGGRDVTVVEHEARQVFREVRELNRDLLEAVCDEKRVGQVFEYMNRHSGLRWSYLPAHEQQYMLESVRVQLSEYPGMLSYDRMDRDIMRCIADYQSLYAASAPRVCEFLEDQGLEPPIKPGDLREFAEDIYFRTNPPGQNLSRPELGLMRNVDVFSNRTARMLYASPLENMHEKPLGVQKLEARAHAKDLMRGLMAAQKHGADLPVELQEAMIEDLRNQFHATLNHIHQLDVLEANNPLSHFNWQQCKLDELVAALDVLSREEKAVADRMANDAFGETGGRRYYNRIGPLMEEVADLATLVEKDADGDLLPGGRTGAGDRLGERPVQDIERYGKLLARRLESIGVRDVDKKMTQARTRRMSNVPWQTVETTLEPRINNKTLKLDSRITPAAEFRIHMGAPGDADIFPAHLHGKGKPSSKTDEAKHAVNLGESELTIEQGGRPKKLYRGLRSATLMAFGIRNEERRMAATEARCRDLLVSGLKQLWENQPGLFQRGGKIPLRMSTLSLLTPDKFRARTGIHDNERRMQREQIAALNLLKEKLAAGEKLSFTDSSGQMHEVEVDFDFAATNFGVNSLALGSVTRRLAGSWGEAEAINQQGLMQLMGSLVSGDPIDGWAGDFLQGSADDQDKMIVRQLIEQIRDLLETEDYKREGEDAYKMAARVMLLSFKLGLVTHSCCKSGKDRTGEADAAVKRLAAETEALGYVPDPRQPVTQEERILSQMFMLETGNIRWQQMNINRPGYKTSTGKRRLGEKFYDMVHQKK